MVERSERSMEGASTRLLRTRGDFGEGEDAEDKDDGEGEMIIGEGVAADEDDGGVGLL